MRASMGLASYFRLVERLHSSFAQKARRASCWSRNPRIFAMPSECETYSNYGLKATEASLVSLVTKTEEKLTKSRVRLKSILASHDEGLHVRLCQLKARSDCIQRERSLATKLVKIEAANKKF